MAKQSFLPRTDAAKLQWLQNFSSKLSFYAAKYGIIDSEVSDTATGAAALAYWMDYLNRQTQYAQRVTKFKNELIDGVPAGASAPEMPVPQALGNVPPMPQPDVMGRASSIGQRIKKHKDYTLSDGTDLGLEGAEIMIDPDMRKPAISLSRTGGGHVNVAWTKGVMGGIEIYKDSGDGAFRFLAVDTVPGYIDNSALPPTGQSSVWRYKAIYRYNDEQAGEWSDVASITVMAEV